MQAIYHGKPVVAMPFFGDQPNNADKMIAKVGLQPFPYDLCRWPFTAMDKPHTDHQRHHLLHGMARQQCDCQLRHALAISARCVGSFFWGLYSLAMALEL